RRVCGAVVRARGRGGRGRRLGARAGRAASEGRMKGRKLELWLLAALFGGPLLLAVALYYGPWDRHALPRLEAEGRELFEPPLPLPPLVLERDGRTATGRRWALIYATMAPCGASCTEELARLRAVHLALGRDGDRVRRVLLGPPGTEDAVADSGLWRAQL